MITHTDESMTKTEAYAEWLRSSPRLPWDKWLADNEFRECDACGKVESAGGFLDWTNGSCEVCDPDTVLSDPENLRRMAGY